MPLPRKKLLSNPPPANSLASQSTLHEPLRQQLFPARSQSISQSHQQNQQLQLICTWSAQSQSGPSPSPFPRNRHTLTTTATAPYELFLFGGYARGPASCDTYVFSTRDFSTTLLKTSGEIPTPRAAHGAALIGTTLLVCGGKTSSGDQNVLNHDSLYLLNLVSREWTRVVVNGPGPGRRYHNTITAIGSKLFVFGGQAGGKTVNDMWTLDLNCLKSQPLWEPCESTPGSEKPLPLPRSGHVSVTTEECIIIFGGTGGRHYYNDTWSFDVSTRKWTELQCTGSIPSPRSGHAAVLVDGVMYVFGGYSSGKIFLDDLYALHLSTRRWFRFHNVGTSPHRRACHAMASDGTRVFVLGGYSKGAQSDEISLIHVFDTKDIKYPETECIVVNPDEKTTQLARKSSTGPPIQEQPQHRKSSLPEVDSRLQNATPAVSSRAASLQITPEGNLGPNERIMHLERRLSVSLTERDQRIAQLTDELALKSARLEQAETNAAEAVKRTGLEHADRLVQKSLVEQKDAELVDVQAKLDELVVCRDQQVGQHEEALTNVRAELEAKESELEAVRLRLTDTEKDLTKSKAEAVTLRAQAATGSMNRDEDQDPRGLIELMRALEIQVERASKGWSEKGIEEMDCRNEG